jgi:hypothetical protein
MTDIAEDAPIRLSEAARLCFPDGSMTDVGLRRLIKKRLLGFEIINNRYYTTIQAIKEMRQRCRVDPKARDCGSGPVAVTGMANSMEPCSLSSIRDAKSRLDARLKKQTEPKERLRPTSRKSVNAA